MGIFQNFSGKGKIGLEEFSGIVVLSFSSFLSGSDRLSNVGSDLTVCRAFPSHIGDSDIIKSSIERALKDISFNSSAETAKRP